MAEGLDVTVLDNSTGQPISGLNVGCTQSGTEYYSSKTTGSDGKVRFEGLAVPGGFVSVVVNQGGYLGYEQKRVDGITIYEGQYTQRTVKLSPDGTTPPPPPPPNGDDDPQNYVVTVNDTAARPIEGATVEGHWYDISDVRHNFSVNTNDQGKVQVFRTPESNVDHWSVVLITAEGYAPFEHVSDIPPEQHTYQRNLFPASHEGGGVVLKVDPRVTEISPGQTIKIYGEIWNGGEEDNIKIVWGLFQPDPFIQIQSREVVKRLKNHESFTVDEDFTLPADYDKDTVLVIAAGYHEE